jgi:hypothetical protein
MEQKLVTSTQLSDKKLKLPSIKPKVSNALKAIPTNETMPDLDKVKQQISKFEFFFAFLSWPK